ncbi:hypothetical protein [Clostridium sp.]
MHNAVDDNSPQAIPPELLSFIDQVQISSRLKEQIDSYSANKNDESFKQRW